MKPKTKEKVSIGLANIAILCLAYAITGRLALMLAVPPGYATATFPSAGIAVTALLLWGNRLWPGVLLGSLLLNVWVSLEHGPLTVFSLEVAVSAATGATLQALAGAWLVRRFVGFPTALSKELDIFKFMVAAGPLACLLNASFGVTALYATGIIAQADFGFSWFTWWVGDTIGVLIAAPMMLIAFAHPRTLWWGRRTTVAVPLLVGLSSVIILFAWASKVEQAQIQADFNEISNTTYERLRKSFTVYINSVGYVERFVATSSQVTREAFHKFVAYPLANNPGTHALSWNPVVPHDQRDHFKNIVRKEGFSDFQITERDTQNHLIRAKKRNTYIPVQYIEPMKGNEKAFGFDVASSPTRLKAIREATDTGANIATSRITLIQERSEQYGFLLLRPVYNGEPHTVEDRRRALRGIAVGVFRVGDIVNAALKKVDTKSIFVNIYEKDGETGLHLYGPKEMSPDIAAVASTDQIEIGGKTWLVRLWPSPQYLSSHRSWQAWALLAGGLLFSSLLGAFLLAMTGRNYQVANLVARRTAELGGILTTAIEAIITLDANGKIETINPAGETLFGYASTEIVGESINTIIPDFFTGSTSHSNRTADMAAAGRRDAYAIRKDNTNVLIELAVSAVAIPDRTLYTVIIHDLTERQKIDRMKDEFVSTVSHELRTPLTSIKGVLGLIVGGALDNAPERIKAMLKVADDNCDRLGRLINDLLEFNKLKLSESELQLRPVSVNALIDKTINANQGYAVKYGVLYSWKPSEEADVYVNGDEDKLVQALSNLLSNAVKYSPRDGQVLVSTSHTSTEVRIAISDAGPGIPLEFQDRVFEKFSQADSSDTRRVGGTGLGMAITRSLVEQHGGRIGFVSLPGQGTTFHIDLPVVRGGDS